MICNVVQRPAGLEPVRVRRNAHASRGRTDRDGRPSCRAFHAAEICPFGRIKLDRLVKGDARKVGGDSARILAAGKEFRNPFRDGLRRE